MIIPRTRQGASQELNMSSDPYNIEINPLLVILSGPSGVGKDTVLTGLKQHDQQFHFVVTVNTRPKRPDEMEGVDYHFISKERFAEMIDEDELLEHAVVYGDYKGIPKQQVRDALASGKDVLMRLDVQGAATVRRLVPEAVLIFITAPSEQELIERLRARKTEPPDQLQLRIAESRQEMKRASEFDYVVINRQGAPDEAVSDVLAVIRAEHCRVHQRTVTL
jgi:guanylate kinase